MRKALGFFLLALLVAGAYLAGSWHTRRRLGGSRAAERRPLYYVDPMHPAYRADKPGTAPDCGMELVPVYAGETPAEPANVSAAAPRTVVISTESRQRIGVRISRVEKTSATYRLRVFGRVAPDEARVYKVNAGLDGYIREVSAVTTGSRVVKDQWLATFFSLDTRAPIQAYLTALDVLDRAARSGQLPEQIHSGDASAQLSVERLKSVGLSALQIEEIKRTREAPVTARILSPADGFVLARNVSPSQKFEKGTEWYRIADLSRVWILADVFENEGQYLRPGVRAQVSVPHQGKVLVATVSEILPQFDAASRTLKVRLETDNPGYILRPDMFVDAELAVTLPPAIAVPADAVLDSGLTKTVFVERDEGSFEPRAVETGWRFGGQVQIRKGLAEGERIVTAGNFLLDSESRMQLAAAAEGASAKDPVCGMGAAAGKSGYSSEYGGRRYYFCSLRCKQEFAKAPQRYLNKSAGGKHGAARGVRS